jgi:multidrug efflux pump subunit AcrB
MRKKLPEKVIPWLTALLEKYGVLPEVARQRAETCLFGFEPGDIISEVMSFGSPTPIEVVVASPNLADARMQAQRVREEMSKIDCLRDVQFQQTLDYPTVEVEIDREKAGLSGVTAQQVGDAAIVATSSSRFIALNYWKNPATGFDYQVEVLVPVQRMTSSDQVERLPITRVNNLVNLMVRDVAKVTEGTMPGEYDRIASQRYLSVTANVHKVAMGHASTLVKQALAAAGAPPRGVRVSMRGQLQPMDEMFRALSIGLSIAVVVILILLTAYFESPRLALISVSAVPCVLAGVVTILYLSGTTLNLESFMGTIMCIGVSVSNSVMLVTFAAVHWHDGAKPCEAAIRGAAERLRPILMTACAMTVGMIPMSLALEEGSQMQAPLGRAVIGGLIMSTIATLVIVPCIFALVLGKSKRHSVSVYPDDVESAYYDPPVDDTPPQVTTAPEAT